MKRFSKINGLISGVILALIVVSSFYFFRIDLTSDKRYSISAQTKNLMKSTEFPLEITIFLAGDLNPGFLRLKNATLEMLNELNIYSKKTVKIHFENPSETATAEKREEKHMELAQRGMTPTSVYEKDKEGKAIQKIIFPWAELKYNGKTKQVNLLKNLRGFSGEENLNISIENLEFELTDAIRQLVNRNVTKIAFLEGHGEFPEPETYDVSRNLSRYFQIDRGVIGTDVSILKNYKAVVIARPAAEFSEKDKFVIDQYIMNGGRVLWLIDGVRLSKESLSQSGQTPVIPLHLNLEDMLFRYGIRINPVILEDVQSAMIPMNIAPKGEKPQFEPMPFVFSPLLMTAPEHPVTKNIPPVKASFTSALEIVDKNKELKGEFLLATSNNTHVLQTPANISLSQAPDLKDKTYFNKAYIPVAAVLEGNFQSVFANRMPPRDIINPPAIKKQSETTRQIFVSNGEIIRNDVVKNGDSIQTFPAGFDRYMNRQFGNREFITNAILYLADQDGWMNLKSKTVVLRLLNKDAATRERLKWQLINVLMPLLILLAAAFVYQWLRKRKYAG